ncbi:MAG: alkaline phosphatase D family protein [Planctomycetota bacterium]|jgi:phosphodiesterase/alkaline phosphatase D-like protein
MLRKSLKINITVTLIFLGLFFSSPPVLADQFQSRWPENVKRIWTGPEYWANRLQDWHISNGRLECTTSGNNRNIHILTCQLGEQKGNFEMSVKLGRIDKKTSPLRKGWVGFRVGSNAFYNDYRQNVIYGKGLDAGISTDGELFIGSPAGKDSKKIDPAILKELELKLTAAPITDKNYKLTLTALDIKSGKELCSITREKITADKLTGNLLLVSSQDWHVNHKKAELHFWFYDWNISGSKVNRNDNQIFGPILFAQYTLSNRIMKMTAQMPPMGKMDGQTVCLQLRKGIFGSWKTMKEEKIHPLARTAAFRIENFNDRKNTQYRLAYTMIDSNGKPKEFYWRGTIRRNPVDKETIVVAGFTGNNDFGFPNNEVVKHVKIHNPDMLVFTGDQIYENVAGYWVQRSPLEKATLDYLRKWYIFGWSFADLMRDRPCICLPDDHDVYQSNIWGAGGRKADGEGEKGQDSGGYTMPPEWINMIQRTQTSHLPDPYDPTPVKQNIGVYCCELNYGDISFALIEDRKFKSSAAPLIPDANIHNGFFHNKQFDPLDSDVPEAILLGDRQLKFLEHWTQDWSDGTWMKVLLSQTIFADVATLPKGSISDRVVPKLRILKAGEYPPDDEMTADVDTNGWPHSKRNKALEIIRKAFAFHIAGDQHLGSVTQYGIDKPKDAGFAFCVPAVANVFPRRWFPSKPGLNREPGSPKYTGDFTDKFGNPVTVYAVSNPTFTGREPAKVYDRATGYGIVKFHKPTRNVTIECWPRFVDPTDPNTGTQYPGWPITINQLDNYNREAAAYLPAIEIQGMTDPVIQVIDEAEKEIVYTLRIKGNSFRPKVFKKGIYTVKIGEPNTEKTETLTGLKSIPPKKDQLLKIKF